MQYQKRLAILTALVLAAAFTACGKSDGQPQATGDPNTESAVTETVPATEAPTEPETEATTETPVNEHIDILRALADTVWSGVNGDNGAFAVAFEPDSKFTYVTQNGDVTEGYFTLNHAPGGAGNSIHVYEDAEMEGKVIRSIPLQFNLEKNVLRLEGKVYMVTSGESGAEAARAEAANLPAAADAYAKLKGVYWGGGDSAYALIFMLNEDGSCDMHYYDATDGIIDEATFYWAMSSDTICFYNEDFAPVMHFNWKMDGDTFTLSDATTGNTVACTQLPPDQASEVSRQLGVLAGAYDNEDGADGDYGYNYEDFDVSVDVEP